MSLSEELSRPLNNLPLDRVRQISSLFDDELIKCLNSYEASVEQYTSTGGTSKAATGLGAGVGGARGSEGR